MKVKQRKSKKKKLLIVSSTLLLIIAFGVTFFYSCASHPEDATPPADSLSICLVPPSNGTSPKDYDALTNVGYMVGRLSSRSFYHTENNGTVTADAGLRVTQHIAGSKNYKDGIMITSSISISENETLAPSKALQKFFGNDKAVVRYAKSSKASDWNGLATEWQGGEPDEVIARDQYSARYGLWGTEFSDYVINQDSFVSASEIVREGDVNVLSVTLDNDAATYYYKQQMRTMGNLKSDPAFTTVVLTFRFADDWTVLSYDIHEEYETYVAFITANCVGDSTITFSYDEEDVDVSDYENYFIRYADAATVDIGQQEYGIVDYFTYGFASVLDGTSTFDICAQIDGQAVDGALLLEMKELSPVRVQAKLGDLKILYAQDTLYADYKDFFGKISVDSVMALLPATSDSFDLDLDALLDELLGGTLSRSEGKVTVDTSLSLFGLHISLSFDFVEEGDCVQWDNIDASLEAAGMKIFLSLTPSELSENAFVMPDLSDAVDLEPYIEGIRSFVENKNYLLTAQYNADTFGVTARVAVNTEGGLAVGGTLEIAYAGNTVPVSFTCIENTVWLSVYDLNFTGTFGDIEELFERISSLFGLEIPDPLSGVFGTPDSSERTDVAEGNESKFSVSSLVSAVLGLDFNSVIKGLSLTDEALALSVDCDRLLSAFLPVFGVELPADFSLGTLAAQYDVENNAFALSVLGAEFCFTENTEIISAPDAEGYVSVSALGDYIEKIVSLVTNKNYQITAEYVGENLSVSASLVLNIGGEFSASGTAVLTVNGNEIPIGFTLKDGTIWLSVYKNIRISATLSELGGAIEQIRSACPDIFGAIPDMSTVSLDSGKLTDALLSLGYEGIFNGLTVGDEVLSVRINGDALLGAVLSALGLETDISVGEIGLNYDVTEGALSLCVAGVKAELRESAASVTLPADADEYVPFRVLEQFIDPVLSLVNATDISFSLAGDMTIQNVPVSAEIFGEVWFADGLRIWLSARVNDAHTVSVYYCEGEITFSCDEYVMRLSEDKLTYFTEKLSSLFAQSEGTIDGSLAAAMLLFSSDGLNLQTLIEGIKLAVGEDNALQIAADLSWALDSLGNINFELGVCEKALTLKTGGIELSGIAFDSLALEIGAAENAYTPDFAAAIECGNVFEFILNAYAELAETQYLALSVEYSSDTLCAKVDGVLRFEQAEEGSSVVLNLDFKAEIIQIEGDTQSGNYIHLIIYRDQLYLTYSLFDYDAANALRVTLPVSELFVAGETILPILAPLLGIGEDTYYFAFVNAILGGYRDLSNDYTTINSTLFGVMNTQEWIDLIFGIIDEYTTDGTQTESDAPQAANTQVTFDFTNLCIGVTAGGLTVNIFAAIDVAIVAPSAEGFIDASSIANLLQDVLYAYNYKSFGYHLTGSFSVAVIGITLDLTIGADVTIGVEEDGSVYMNIRLTANGYYNALFIAVIGGGLVVNGDTVTDITISGGNVYMTRTQTTYRATLSFKKLSTPYCDYKAMTMSEFSANMMDEIFFALNFSDKFKNYIIEQSSGSDSGENTYDAGQMLSGYEFTNDTYAVSLDLGAIANASEFGNMTLNIKRGQRSDGNYDLTGLSGSLKIVSVVTVNYTLKNETPTDFSNIYGDLSPSEFASEVKDGSLTPYRLADSAVNSNLFAVCSALGYADVLSLAAAVAASGVLSYANH